MADTVAGVVGAWRDFLLCIGGCFFPGKAEDGAKQIKTFNIYPLVN